MLIFTNYYCGTTLFIHTHFFAWGAVTHSHPYLPSNHHSHSDAEYQALALLDNIIVDDNFSSVDISSDSGYALLDFFTLPEHPVVGTSYITSLRAPPAYC